MIGMVVDAKPLFDPAGHAGTGPERGSETRRFRAPEQGLLQPLPLGGTESRRPSASGLSGQRLPALVACGRVPSSNAATINPNPLRDFDRTESLLQQSQRAVTTLLQFVRTATGTHTSSIGHYLCRNQ